MSHDFLVSFPGLGIQDIPVDRVAFRLFGLEIYWYGILIALAVIVTLFLAFREAPKFGLSKDHLADAFILLMPLMVICARIYYVLFEWPRYQGNWRLVFDTRDGGLAFYGGVLGGVLAIFIASRWHKLSFAKLVDFLVVYVPLGQAIGRWGNFFNQEAFGSNTSLPWGMISNGTRDYLAHSQLRGVNPLLPVHPTFLYEFVANILIFFILHRIRKESKQPYETLSWYIMTYGIVRFFVERIRTDALVIPGTTVRISLILSIVMALGGGIYIAIIRRSDRRWAAPAPASPDFLPVAAAPDLLLENRTAAVTAGSTSGKNRQTGQQKVKSSSSANSVNPVAGSDDDGPTEDGQA